MPHPWPKEGREGHTMGTDYRPQEKKAFGSFRKVSKPLMEKKRRARINVSLEQLKALLEKHYSHQIQKRKLEKADILELSVKYMKSLQRTIQGAPLTKSADYQAGFRSCLQGVRQFLLRSEAASEANSFQLLHELARALPSGVGVFSTMDSGPAAALPEIRLTAMGSAGAPPFPACGKGRSLKAQARARGSEDPGGSRIQARSERGLRAQALPERDEQLWRPW